MATDNLSAAEARQLLAYDADSGALTWLAKGKKRAGVGKIAGYVHRTLGYRYICIEGTRYLAHRLAWLHMTGAHPLGDIDHINGDKSDNRARNLREATRSQNMQNTYDARSGNKCGFLGVSAHGRGWRAQIKIAGKSIKLGTFETPELAHAAYVDAKRRLHPAGML